MAALWSGVGFLLVAGLACAQRPAPAPAFDGGRAFEHLKQIVAIGPRPAGSPGAQRTRDYITAQMTALGLTAAEQPFDAATPLGRVKMANLRVMLPGDGGRGRVIIGGHYDTKLFQDIRFVGANDGGSSTAFLIEFARVLTARRNRLPVEILFLDGEEAVVEWSESDSTYGSRHYVSAARAAGALQDIRAFILVDMIADRDLRVLRDSNSTPWLIEAIWGAAGRLKRREFADADTAIEDDHLPFVRAGVPAVDIIDLDYGPWHTAADTIDEVSAKSLQAVGDVLLAALPDIEARLLAQ
jgi:glutaminyl-peptide cyclotransferase